MAMIEVTAKVQEAKKADDDRAELHAELAALRATIAAKKAAGGGEGGEVVQTKEGPMNSVESCAKRLAAMKLCEQIPFPGLTICKSSTESSFPCPKGPDSGSSPSRLDQAHRATSRPAPDRQRDARAHQR